MTSEIPSKASPQEMAVTGLKICRRISDSWGLSEAEESELLGVSSQCNEVSPDSLERFSYILGIYKNLRILFPTEQRASEWVRKPNKAFGGRPAIEVMIEDPAPVRRYLDSQLV